MFRYTTVYINAISLLISIILFFFTNFFISNIDSTIHKNNIEVKNEIYESNQNLNSEQNINKFNNENNISKKESKVIVKDMAWYIEIPCINLKAEIEEGTNKEILEDYVGHFEESQKDTGNIGLAAHNRGYKNNYFKEIKKLKEGDMIYYHYNDNTRKYLVKNNFIIEDTNWTVLNNTDENIITLITCVENEPNYRRCVQAKEIDNE